MNRRGAFGTSRFAPTSSRIAIARTAASVTRARSPIASTTSAAPLLLVAAATRPRLARRRRRPSSLSLSSSSSSSSFRPSALSSPSAGGRRPDSAAATENDDEHHSHEHHRRQRWRWDESDDAVRAYASLAAVLAAGALAASLDVPHASLPYFIGVASITIYVGAHRGLTTRRRQDIGLRESLLFPLGAAFSLGCVYLFVTFFEDLDLSALLDAYFFVLSSSALYGAAAPPLRRVLGGGYGGGGGDDDGDYDSSSSRSSSEGSGERSGDNSSGKNPGFELPLPSGLLLGEDGDSVTKATLRLSDLAALAFALAVASADLATHHQDFTLSNACAAAVAAEVLQLLGLRSFRAAALLLGGLAAYDVLAVFASGNFTQSGDSVMMTVATAATGPTRLLFPRSAADLAASSSPAPFPFSLLGLGDVAIPGLLACLALKYDASRSVDMNARAAAAARAIDGALAELSATNPMAGDREYGEAAADAADAAFEIVAEAEARARDATTSRSSSSSPSVASSVASAASASSMSETSSTSEAPPSPVVVVTEAILGNRTYFSAVMGSYALGLLVAFGVNAATGAGQPALLYLCPATLGAVAATAARRKEVERIASYTVAAGKPLFAGKKKKETKGEEE